MKYFPKLYYCHIIFVNYVHRTRRRTQWGPDSTAEDSMADDSTAKLLKMRALASSRLLSPRLPSPLASKLPELGFWLGPGWEWLYSSQGQVLAEISKFIAKKMQKWYKKSWPKSWQNLQIDWGWDWNLIPGTAIAALPQSRSIADIYDLDQS